MEIEPAWPQADAQYLYEYWFDARQPKLEVYRIDAEVGDGLGPTTYSHWAGIARPDSSAYVSARGKLVGAVINEDTFGQPRLRQAGGAAAAFGLAVGSEWTYVTRRWVGQTDEGAEEGREVWTLTDDLGDGRFALVVTDEAGVSRTCTVRPGTVGEVSVLGVGEEDCPLRPEVWHYAGYPTAGSEATYLRASTEFYAAPSTAPPSSSGGEGDRSITRGALNGHVAPHYSSNSVYVSYTVMHGLGIYEHVLNTQPGGPNWRDEQVFFTRKLESATIGGQTVEVPVTLDDPRPPEPLSLRAWPNPTSGWVDLEVGRSGQNEILVSVFDAVGRLVQSRTLDGARRTERVDLPGLPAGVYTIRAQTASATAQVRIVIVR